MYLVCELFGMYLVCELFGILDHVIAPSHTHQSIQKRNALKLSVKTSYF